MVSLFRRFANWWLAKDIVAKDDLALNWQSPHRTFAPDGYPKGPHGVAKCSVSEDYMQEYVDVLNQQSVKPVVIKEGTVKKNINPAPKAQVAMATVKPKKMAAAKTTKKPKPIKVKAKTAKKSK